MLTDVYLSISFVNELDQCTIAQTYIDEDGCLGLSKLLTWLHFLNPIHRLQYFEQKRFFNFIVKDGMGVGMGEGCKQ